MGDSPTSTPAAVAAKLATLFSNTRLLSFGRYALQVPADAQIAMGENEVHTFFMTHPNTNEAQAKKMLEDHWRRIKDAELFSSPAEIIGGKFRYNSASQHHFYWYFDSGSAKELGLDNLYGIVLKPPHAFSYRGWSIKNIGDRGTDATRRTEEAVAERFCKALRLRDNYEQPQKEQGFCINLGFIPENTFSFYELSHAGFYFPSMPGVVFSVGCNMGATKEKNLLELYQEERKNSGLNYGFEELRKGLRKLHGHWNGEELLLRNKKTGQYRFEWMHSSPPGTKGTIQQPSLFTMHLSTGIKSKKTDTTAPTSGLNEAETIALFDRLVQSLKYRVQIPGVPPEAAWLPAK